jgi:hypothetical protein
MSFKEKIAKARREVMLYRGKARAAKEDREERRYAAMARQAERDESRARAMDTEADRLDRINASKARLAKAKGPSATSKALHGLGHALKAGMQGYAKLVNAGAKKPVKRRVTKRKPVVRRKATRRTSKRR